GVGIARGRVDGAEHELKNRGRHDSAHHQPPAVSCGVLYYLLTFPVLPAVVVGGTSRLFRLRHVSPDVLRYHRREWRLLARRISNGHYDLQLDLSGFASTAIENIELLVDQNASIPLSMKLATVNETIVVSDAALVDDPFLAELESDARYRDLMARLRLPIRR